MAAPCFIAWNGLTGALNGATLTAVTTGTSTTVPKTMLQVRPGTSTKIRVVEWGYAFDAAPAAPVKVELVDCGAIYATVTSASFVVHKYNDVTGQASQVQIGTSHTGFTGSAEGTVTASRLLGYEYDNAQYFKQQFPLGREPEVNADQSLRIRVTMGSAAALNMICYIIWEE